MDLHIKTLVFNENYINIFLNYSFPSLLAHNNLPEAIKLANIEYHIYTHTQEEVNKISNELEKYNKLLPIKVQIAPIEDYRFYFDPSRGDSTSAQEAFYQHFSIDNPDSSPTFFSNSDVVWSSGSLTYLVKSFLEGNVAIFPTIIRTSAETIIPELNSMKVDGVIDISPLLSQQLIIKHLSPIHGAFNTKSLHFPQWSEEFCVPVGNEGILLYHTVRGFYAFIPRSFNVINNSLVNEEFSTYKMDVIKNANLCVGLDLTPLPHKTYWLEQGKPFNVGDISFFLKNGNWGNPLSFNIELMKRPLRICIVENSTVELWNNVEKEIEDELIKEIIEYDGGESNNSIIPNSPRQLQIEALEWLEQVIDGRFKQATLEYLRGS